MTLSNTSKNRLSPPNPFPAFRPTTLPTGVDQPEPNPVKAGNLISMTTTESQTYQKLVQWGIDNGLIRRAINVPYSVETMKRNNYRARADSEAVKAYRKSMKQIIENEKIKA